MPRLRYARSSAADAAGSSPGTSRSSASTTVTSTPKERQAEASSTPITPPPRTTAEVGSVSSRIASVLVSTRSPSGTRPGSVLGCDPDASTTYGAVSVCSPSAVVTATAGTPLPGTRRPSPATTVIPREATSPVSPLWRRDTTPCA